MKTFSWFTISMRILQTYFLLFLIYNSYLNILGLSSGQVRRYASNLSILSSKVRILKFTLSLNHEMRISVGFVGTQFFFRQRFEHYHTVYFSHILYWIVLMEEINLKLNNHIQCGRCFVFRLKHCFITYLWAWALLTGLVTFSSRFLEVDSFILDLVWSHNVLKY